MIFFFCLFSYFSHSICLTLFLLFSFLLDFFMFSTRFKSRQYLAAEKQLSYYVVIRLSHGQHYCTTTFPDVILVASQLFALFASFFSFT